MSVLSGREAQTFIDVPCKINPCGVDLVPLSVTKLPLDHTFAVLNGKDREFKKWGTAGTVGIPVSDYEKAVVDKNGLYLLPQGVYLVRLPKVKIPLTATGIAYPRSSLLRLGVLMLPSAIWDSGYEGEGIAVFQVLPELVKIGVTEAWLQLVFFENKEVTKGYDGFYQKEQAKK